MSCPLLFERMPYACNIANSTCKKTSHAHPTPAAAVFVYLSVGVHLHPHWEANTRDVVEQQFPAGRSAHFASARQRRAKQRKTTHRSPLSLRSSCLRASTVASAQM
jgi:hypothetical protein